MARQSDIGKNLGAVVYSELNEKQLSVLTVNRKWRKAQSGRRGLAGFLAAI
jgi:hypothetical protein